jgi:hypothetical protein
MIWVTILWLMGAVTAGVINLMINSISLRGRQPHNGSGIPARLIHATLSKRAHN